jgi:hypothetical protein
MLLHSKLLIQFFEPSNDPNYNPDFNNLVSNKKKKTFIEQKVYQFISLNQFQVIEDSKVSKFKRLEKLSHGTRISQKVNYFKDILKLISNQSKY